MMTKNIVSFLSFLLILNTPNALSQTFSSRIVIHDFDNDGEDVHCADFDNDGDLDIAVGFHSGTNKIVWYANDGNENFGDPQEITTDVDQLRDIAIFDVDNDGDIDLVSASQFDQKVAWYENSNDGSNWTPHILTSTADYANSIAIGDLDDDGLKDIVYAAPENDEIAWFKNLGNGDFSSSSLPVSTNMPAVVDISLSDVDGDGDLDVFSADWTDIVAWNENDGSGNFSPKQIIDDAIGSPFDVQGADLDGDEDTDLVITSFEDDNLVGWYENNGSGSFSTIQIIEDEVGQSKDAYPVDIDNDGDFDILSCSQFPNLEIMMLFNDGSGNFTKEVIDTDNDRYYTSLPYDLDGDGDLDIVAITLRSLVWYENLTPLSIPSILPTLSSKLYPNPSEEYVILAFNKNIHLEKIEVLDAQGRLVESILFDENVQEITLDLKDYRTGIYYSMIHFDGQEESVKFVME